MSDQFPDVDAAIKRLQGYSIQLDYGILIDSISSLRRERDELERQIKIRERQLALAVAGMGQKDPTIFVVMSGNRIYDIVSKKDSGHFKYEIVPIPEIEAFIAAKNLECEEQPQ